MARTLTGAGYFLAKRVGKAIGDYKMIKAGDRVLVGVSGGKDSLTLLTILHERKKWVPIDYDIFAAHVQTDYRCKNCAHVETLKKLFEERGYKYYIKNIEILKNPDGTANEVNPALSGSEEKPSGRKGGVNCFWCSWNRRKVLFDLAAELKCNKIAFGHHRDDIVETTLLNLFYQGEISTMSPKVSMFKGELDIIRPMAYVLEKDIVRFAKEKNFPSQICACPNGKNSQRKRMKEIIQEIENRCPRVKDNIFNSMKRIKKDYLV